MIPAEALLEAEPGDWWTIGRRVRLGRAAAPLLDRRTRAALSASARCRAPYEHLAGEVDGRAVFVAGVLAGNAIWAEVPSPLPDRWSSSELDYNASFEAGGTALRARDHTGGDVDWFTVDGEPGAPARSPARRLAADAAQVIPGRLDYPGAPNPRWWQLEDRAVDIGGFAPDRSHFAHACCCWTWCSSTPTTGSPSPCRRRADPAADPSSGVLVTLARRDGARQLRRDLDRWQPRRAAGPGGWSLFHTAGLPRIRSCLVWPVAVAPQPGPVLDEILIGVDEDANLAWAVELRADGLQLLRDAETAAAIAETTRTGTRTSAICRPRPCRTAGIRISACGSAIRSRAAAS